MAHTILGILLIIQGVWSQDRAVVVQSQCGVRGTSVTIPCSYRNPSRHQVTSFTWYKRDGKRERTYTRLSDIPSLSGRFEYLGDKPNLCTLKISDLRDEDKGEYGFIFFTEYDGWQSQDMALTVEVMTAVVPTVVKEGDMVRLTCSTACPGYLIENPVWSRDGEAVASPTFQARLEDAGSYQCAVEPLRSNAVALDVQYLPRNTTVQVEPPGEVSRGSSVNLTCSSVANPPVHNYTWWWYNGTTPPTVSSMLVQVGTGQVLHRPSLEASQRGRYLCQARNPLGEHNASALLQMEETTLGKTFVVVLCRGGVTVFATLGIVLVCLWSRKQRRAKEKRPAHDSQEGEIAFSTIGNVRETRPVKHRDSNVNLKEQPFESPEAGEAGGQHVTYSTV